MSAQTEVRSSHLSPGLVATIGFVLMLAAFVVDVTTDSKTVKIVDVAAAEQPVN